MDPSTSGSVNIDLVAEYRSCTTPATMIPSSFGIEKIDFLMLVTKGVLYTVTDSLKQDATTLLDAKHVDVRMSTCSV